MVGTFPTGAYMWHNVFSWGWTEQGDMDYAVAELKNQAAKLGANGVILITTGERTSTNVGTYSSGATYTNSSTAQTLTGKAIYVTKQ